MPEAVDVASLKVSEQDADSTGGESGNKGARTPSEAP
jgi:hypothetical protein